MTTVTLPGGETIWYKKTGTGAPLLHIHGVLATAWVLFLISQSVLVTRGSIARHRDWGLFGISLASVASQFDPARQRFVWVLPPGIHGEGPWDFSAVVRIRGEQKFETTLPLKAELAPAGSRPSGPTTTCC